jgi:acyl-CoA reductase-like NAD-dependent aldehyde dehydrogenase
MVNGWIPSKEKQSSTNPILQEIAVDTDEVCRVVNPSTGKVITAVAAGSDKDVDKAVEAAWQV